MHDDPFKYQRVALVNTAKHLSLEAWLRATNFLLYCGIMVICGSEARGLDSWRCVPTIQLAWASTLDKGIMNSHYLIKP